MLRTLSLALLAAAAAGAASAQTAGGERFAIGVVGGTTGLGVEGQFHANEYINLRIAGDAFSYETDFGTDDVDYASEIDFKTFGGFVDIHPFANALFVSAGVYSGDRSVSVSATSNQNAEIGDVIFTPAQIGTLTGTVDFGGGAPFLGVGFNNTFRSGGRIGFKALAGAAFGEDPTVELRRSGGAPLAGPIATQFDQELRKEERELAEDAKDLKTFPILQLGLTYRF